MKALLKNGLSLTGNVLKPLAEYVLIPLALEAASSTETAIYRKIFGSGRLSNLVSFVNDNINHCKQRDEWYHEYKSLDKSAFLIKD